MSRVTVTTTMDELLPPDRDWALHQGDCLAVQPTLGPGTVSLIVADPPYFRVVDQPWDRQWKTEADYLDWIGRLCEQWQKVLKPNGSLYVFASPRMAAKVEVEIGKWFNVVNSIVWRKLAGCAAERYGPENFRGFVEMSERIVFAEQLGEGGTGLDAILNDQSLFGPIRDYFWGEREKISHLSYNEINERMGLASNGGGMASNILNSRKINWEFPTRQTYELLARVTGVCQADYDELRREYEEYRAVHETLRRPFSVTADVPYTDVWDFPTVAHYPGKHVCEKPAELCSHIVNASSRPGDMVLDPFCGSGVVPDVCRSLGRRCIAIETDAKYVARIRRRLDGPPMPLFDEALEGDAGEPGLQQGSLFEGGLTP